MAIQSQPSRIPEPFAGSGTKNVIPATNTTPSASQAASWASGFPPECSQPISAGGCPVPRDDVNGVCNQLSQDYSFRQDGGVWEWSALADYDASRVVRGSDGKVYFSVQQSGPSVVAGAQDPTADNGTYWTIIPTDDGNVVHKTGDETIGGVKTFTSGRINFDVNYSTILKSVASSYVWDGTAPGTAVYLGFYLYDSTDKQICAVDMQQSSGKNAFAQFFVHAVNPNEDNNNRGYAVALYIGSASATRTFRSAHDNVLDLGQTSYRWKAVYAATGSIQTSDARLKTEPEAIPDAVLDAWSEVDFVQFQFRDSVAEKGEDARLHSGLIAQRIDEAFKARGLDVSRYGLFCYDVWEDQPAELREDGSVALPALEAGDRYSLRYEEALCMEAAYQRRRADRAEARLAALEERLATIEAKLG